MVAPFVIPAITGGLSMIGRAVQGGPPQYQSDPELRKRMQGQQQRYEQMVKGRGPSLGRQMLQEGLERGLCWLWLSRWKPSGAL